MSLNEQFDLLLELMHAGEGISANGTFCDEDKRVLELIDSGAVRGCEMQVNARVTRQTGIDLGVLVREIIQHQMREESAHPLELG